MSPGDFRQFVFRTPEQWQGGVGFRVHPLARGGFELFSAPAFDRWITRAPEARGLTSFVVDESGRVLWLHRADGWLYCLDPANGLVDRGIQLAEPASGQERGFGRMLQDERSIVWGEPGKGAALSVLYPFDGQPYSTGNGVMVALTCASPTQVEQIYQLALSLGAKDEGAPGIRSPDFYAAYFRDLDGNKVNVFCFGAG